LRRKTPEVIISREELVKLPTYSCTLPTTYKGCEGYRWKRDVLEPRRHHGVLPRDTEPEWMIGEYYDIGSDKEIGIKWAWAMEEPGKVWRGWLRT
jgi:hypothetical protein